MKSTTWRSMVVAASLFAVAFSAAPGPAQHRCEAETNFLYCGDHVPASRLPLHFSFAGGGPAGTGGAISAAMQSWNVVFPGNKVGCNPLCLADSGTSTISFGNPSACPKTSANAVAVACLTYDPPGSHKIKKVDIILNSSLNWRVASGADLAAGEATGATWGNLPGANWYDVQSVLTHEFGHALGLEHIGNADGPFPRDLTDTWKYQETMYRWYFRGSTAPRTLGAGDIAGIYRVATDTYTD